MTCVDKIFVYVRQSQTLEYYSYGVTFKNLIKKYKHYQISFKNAFFISILDDWFVFNTH